MITLINLIIFILSSVGCTFIVTESYIFSPIREYITKKIPKLGYLLGCNQCMGMWVGMFISLIFINLSIYTILFGCITSLISKVLTEKINF